jgi:hypothetical protein
MTRTVLAAIGRTLLVVLIVACVTSTTMATTVVALRGQNRVLLAADSLVIRSDGALGATCKIIQGDGCFFAVSGPFLGPKYDARSIGRAACRLPGDVAERADRFLALVEQPLLAFHIWTAEKAPQRLRGQLNVPFVGKQGNQLALLHRGYQFTKQQFEQLPKNEVPIGGIGLFGNIAEIQKFAKAKRDWIRQTPAEEVVRQFVELEARAAPKEVGGKISIVEIGLDAARWIDPGECPPIDPSLLPLR